MYVRLHGNCTVPTTVQYILKGPYHAISKDFIKIN
jgi:hypothetical protein